VRVSECDTNKQRQRFKFTRLGLQHKRKERVKKQPLC